MGARKAEMTLLENVWETILTVCLKFCQKNIVFPEQLIHVQDRLQHNLFWCFSYNAIWQIKKKPIMHFAKAEIIYTK